VAYSLKLRELRFAILLCCALFCTRAGNTDSLLQALKTMPADTGKVNALFTLATGYSPSDTNTAYQYAHEMLSLAQKLEWQKGIAKSWQAMGVIAYYATNFNRALPFFERAAAEYGKTSYPRGALLCHFWMARCYRRIADYPNYAKFLTLLEQRATQQNDLEYLGNAHEGFGNLYRYLGQYPKSIEHYTRAIEIAEKRGDKHDESVALNNLSLVYEALGEQKQELAIQMRNYRLLQQIQDTTNLVLCLSNLSSLYEGMGQMDSAKRYLSGAMALIEMAGEKNLDFKDVASVYGQNANILADDKKFVEAIEYYKRAIRLSQDNKDIKSVAGGYSSMADVFSAMKNKTMAEEYYLKSLAINRSIGHLKGAMANYESLESLYRPQNSVRADSCRKLRLVMQDSLKVLTSAEELKHAEALYVINEQHEKLVNLSKEKQLRELEAETRAQRMWLATALLGGAGLLIGLVVLLRRKK
jgi:tetratricopeptide (TPR) repeat protein